MKLKNILLITALTAGLCVSNAGAQEQQMKDQAKDAVAAAADQAVEQAKNAATDVAEAATVAKPDPVVGMWLRRKKHHKIRVAIKDDKLYCTIINRKKRNGKPKKDFEMCHGMTKQGDAWKGKHMKHPEMPGFMTFKGTVTVDGDVLKIKGCAGMCASEKWDRMPAEEAAKYNK